ncbi:MAG: ArsA family ATPase, partial [Deltaproteobacteria bacterium]|nr:ArsA family ATPase [Deltaproteobacteria bacterium]
MSAEPKKGALYGLLERKKVLICCGSGGVGKTTTSAALALYASSLGYKTIVLTIDPAKRLANSLGIQKIDFQEKEIPKAELRRAGLEPKAPLFAMMLDTKRTFDDLILKYAPNEEKAQAILQNKLYQHLSNMIAGSQEYMAMEKLYEVVQERDYDLVVLDTPPSRHALDFLDAPTKMSAMV